MLLTLRGVAFAGILLITLSWALTAAEQPGKSSKELFEYIQDARKLGLKDEQIRKNALAAGWKQDSIDQTYRIVSMLNGERPIAGPSVEGYRIGAGDVLAILVWREPDASVPDALVRADGKITMPLIKEVEVAGLTPAELEGQLTTKLSKLITAPDVTVVPKEINSRKIYMIGAVKKEGPLPLLAPMTVLQAINEAGGLNEYAKRKKIYVLRVENGKQVRLPFNYQAAIKGERMELNIVLQPGDSVVVPQ